uniref:Phosphodiesterase n=1 Tax=Parastrongyloides trichosuri TaxID=131310 RepID=A0A0N4ZI80_PARTI
MIATLPIQDHVIIRQKAEIHEGSFVNGIIHHENCPNGGHKISTLIFRNDSFNIPDNSCTDDCSTFSEKEAYLDTRKISFDFPTIHAHTCINPLRKLSYQQAMQSRKLSSNSCFSWKTVSSHEIINDDKKFHSTKGHNTYEESKNDNILQNSTSETIYLSSKSSIDKFIPPLVETSESRYCETYHKNLLDSKFFMNAKKASVESYTDTDYLITQREQIAVDFEESSDSDSSFAISPSYPMQRKVSLMPALTEEDLLNSDVGYKDPLSIAKVFGEDFASQITFKNDPFLDGGYNESKKKCNIGEDWLDLDFHSNSPLWPFKARDKSLPSGVPSVKLLVRKNQESFKDTPSVIKECVNDKNNLEDTKDIFGRKKGSIIDDKEFYVKASQIPNEKRVSLEDIENNSDYQERCIALPKISYLPKTKLSFPAIPITQSPRISDKKSLPTAPNLFSEIRKASSQFSAYKISEKMENIIKNNSKGDIKNILSENTDMITFQQAINKWLKEQSGVETLSFVLITQDSDVAFATVAGSSSLKSPIICCLSETLIEFFDSKIENGGIENVKDFTKYRLTNLPSLDLEKFNSLLITMILQLNSSESFNQSFTENDMKNLYERCSLLPIRGSNDVICGLLIIHQNSSLRNTQIPKITPHLSMVGSLLGILFNVEDQKKMAMQSEIFFSMTQNVFSSMRDMNELVRNIIKEAKQLVNGEACSLFLLDRENNELVAEVFEENSKTGEYLKEIRMPIDQGIVGYVARTGQTQNVTDVNSNPFFYPKIDEKTGFVTRNILCVPIRDNTSGDLVGVAEVCNKIGAPSFTEHDEKIASTFTILCGMSISHCLLYRKLQEYHRRNHMAAEVLVQGSTMSISPEDILRLSFRKIPEPTSFHPNFNSFQFIPRSIGTGDIYVEASLSMFDELGFIEKYRIRQSTLAKFLLMVQRGYRNVPYHNWSHAFAVAHFCYLLLKLPAVKKALTDLQRLSLLVACLCHDIDHRGTTNAFQLQSKTPLAQLYSSEGSVLERHHFAQTVTILGMDECNIFGQLTRSQYQTVLGHIRQVILATDIAVHLSRADDIRQMVESGFDPQNKDHNDRFLCLLMTASDLSDQSKDFRNTKSIAENIYKEFFSQGDLEKQMGNTPNEMMDREKACVPLIQLNFMDKVALPVFYNLAKLLDELEPTYKTLQTNRRCWEILSELIQEKDDAFGGLEYLKDPELEANVIERYKKEIDAEKNQTKK